MFRQISVGIKLSSVDHGAWACEHVHTCSCLLTFFMRYLTFVFVSYKRTWGIKHTHIYIYLYLLVYLHIFTHFVQVEFAKCWNSTYPFIFCAFSCGASSWRFPSVDQCQYLRPAVGLFFRLSWPLWNQDLVSWIQRLRWYMQNILTASQLTY